MENQHRLIRGYGELDQAQIDHMNALKENEQELISDLETMMGEQGIDRRLVSIAITHIETGFMFANKAIARKN